VGGGGEEKTVGQKNSCVGRVSFGIRGCPGGKIEGSTTKTARRLTQPGVEITLSGEWGVWGGRGGGGNNSASKEEGRSI